MNLDTQSSDISALAAPVHSHKTTAFYSIDDMEWSNFSRGDQRIREVIPVPDSLWKEITFFASLLAEGI